ncbi:MAG: TraR/DksA C4-type zinc finger protein [Ginsengibacter sp.]
MAIQKKKAAHVAKKVSYKPVKSQQAKKAVAKKAIPVKKAASKKMVKKPVPVAKAKSTKKTVPAKKAVVKSAPKKAKVAPGKKAILLKHKPQTKAAPKLTLKTSSKKPIVKHSPDKKTAKTGANSAVTKKLATVKKSTPKKEATPKKVQEVKNKSTRAPVVKAAPKSAEKHVKEPVTSHQANLKKAVAIVKAKKVQEEKKQKPFVMPKTNTERARKYEPEFTRSVLDQAPEENSGPTMRYSDSELVEFRELISKKLETAKKELGYLQGLITRKDQMGGDDTDNRYMTMEDGGLSMEREQLSQMASRQITFIDHLEKAMMRIENKTYGICRVTGKLIDKARLRAVPHATLSIEAKMGIAR